MSTDGVKAGRAYVELSVKDRLTKGLARAKERLAGWAQGLALTGGAIQGGSVAVLWARGAAVMHFAAQWSLLNDISVAPVQSSVPIESAYRAGPCHTTKQWSGGSGNASGPILTFASRLGRHFCEC